jgi:putative aldouronate transport system substrate-binding protein
VKNISDENETKVNETIAKLVAVGAKPFPNLHYSDEDIKAMASITADTSPYVNQYIAEVTTGKKDLESSWDAYITTLKNMGLDKLMTIYTKAYEEATK